MGSEKNISAVLLVICPIVVLAMFFTLLSTIGDADWSDTKGITLLLGENSSNIGTGMAIVTVAMGLMFASYGYVRSTMTGGSGAGLANIGFVLIVGMFAAFLIENGLIAAAADASSTGQAAGAAAAAAAVAAGDAANAAAIGEATASVAGVSIGASLVVASQGVGTIGTIAGFLGFALIGLGMIIQKNWNIVVAILLIITGLLGAIGTPIMGYDSENMAIVWFAMMVSTAVTGVFTYLREE